MKIAVIDGGVIPEFKEGLNIVKDLVVNRENKVVDRLDDIATTTDHGFNVCKIINIYAPDAKIISIRIFNSNETKANIQALVAALKYCLDNEIPIIHLSIGTINLSDDFLLRDIVKKIIDNNQVIVAAHSNEKGLSFPAIYPYVYSVRAAELCSAYEDDKWGYSFLMPSEHIVSINKNINYTTQKSNSYAAPVLTSKIYNIISSKKNNNLLLQDLDRYNNIFLCEYPYFLDDVTIINFGKETILEEILPFKMKDIFYDIKFKPCMGDYIFIPNKNREITKDNLKRFLKMLPKNHKKIRIFYLGTYNNEIEVMLARYKFEFWVLPGNDIYPIGIFDRELRDCGTIYFQGDREFVYYMMAGLRDAFLEDGFNCFAISDNIDSTLYGIYYFKDLSDSKRRKQLEYVLEPDVELIYSKDESFKEIEDSMTIKVRKDNNNFKLLIHTLNIEEEIGLDVNVDFKVLLNHIVSMVNRD